MPRLWDLLGAAGRDSVLLGVPGTYPPSAVQRLGGGRLPDSLDRVDCTYPRRAGARRSQASTGGYVLDVADFRTDDKARVAQQSST